MANLGTPVVIGSLSNATVQSSYTVPITTSSGVTDTIVISASSGTVANNAPNVTSVSDSQGNVYTSIPLNPTVNTVQVFTVWIKPDAAPLSNTDTVTVTFDAATNNQKNIFVIKCPGATTYYAVDQTVSNSLSTSGTNPSVTTGTLNYPNELALFFSNDGTAGGAPTAVGGGFTQLGSTLHAGSGLFSLAAYQLVTTEAPLTGSVTLTTSTNWSGAVITLLPNMQSQYPQQIQPFPVGQLPPQLAFSPAYSTQLRFNPGQLATAVTLPVNFIGSQSNVTNSVTNFLTGDASTFEASNGGWSGGTSVNLSFQTGTAHTGNGAIRLRCTATGARSAFNATVPNLPVGWMPVNPGDTVFASVWVLAAATPETFNAGIDFYTSGGVQVGGTITGPTITDQVNAWTFAYVETVVPATAAYARTHHTVNITGPLNEDHFLDDAVLANLTTGTGSPGTVTIYTPNQQQQFQLTPTGAVPYPLNLNPAYQFLPRQFTTIPNSPVSTLGPVGTVTVNAQFPDQAVQIYQNFYPQYPFPPITPLSLQVNPSLSWLQPQHSTGNRFIYVDAGPGGQVAVNAQYADQTPTVSIPGPVANVNVQAFVTQFGVPGVVANVNVVANAGTISSTLTGTTATVNVQAQAGTVGSALSGAVANVNVQARNGTVSLGPAGPTATVNVAMAGDNVTVVSMGTTANIAVASTGTVTLGPAGPVANANVAAINGIVTEQMIGTPANVNVATIASSTIGPIGTVANVSVAAFPGGFQIAKIINGVTANVNVTSIANPTVTPVGVASGVSSAAPAGTVNIRAIGTIANVTVMAGSPDFAGMITITGTLVDPDILMEQFLSEQGRLLSIPVEDMLVSATTPGRTP